MPGLCGTVPHYLWVYHSRTQCPKPPRTQSQPFTSLSKYKGRRTGSKICCISFLMYGTHADRHLADDAALLDEMMTEDFAMSLPGGMDFASGLNCEAQAEVSSNPLGALPLSPNYLQSTSRPPFSTSTL